MLTEQAKVQGLARVLIVFHLPRRAEHPTFHSAAVSSPVEEELAKEEAQQQTPQIAILGLGYKGIMWRAAGVSYLRYSNEMAAILRQCLREPYREKALQKNTIHLLEKAWVNGAVQSKNVIDDMSKGFETAGGNADRRPSVMNGVQAPLRGSQDMDGEVVERPRQLPATAQAGQATEGVATAVTAAVSNQAHAGNVNPTPSLLAGAGALVTSGILENDSGTPVPAQDGPRPSSHPSGVLSGVLRAVQALPATVETLVNRPAGSRSGQGTPAQHDSVEYASVAASVRSSAERVPPPPPSVPDQGPLFDVPTLARMRQMQESAPLLYPEASTDLGIFE
eukprot:s369_g14.t1